MSPRLIAAAAVLLVGAAALAETELERAEIACEKDFKACKHRDDLRAQEQQREMQHTEEQDAQHRAALDQQMASAEAEDQAATEAQQKKCGADYMRVRVGMKFTRVQKCAGPLSLRYEDGKARVYEGSGGMVRVEGGVVTRVFYR